MNIWWTAAVKPTEALSRVGVNPDAAMRTSYVRFPRRQRQKRVCMLFLPVARFGGKSHLGASMGNVRNTSVDELPDRGRSRLAVSAISRQGYSFPILAVFLLYATLILLAGQLYRGSAAQARSDAACLRQEALCKGAPGLVFWQVGGRRNRFARKKPFPGAREAMALQGLSPLQG